MNTNYNFFFILKNHPFGNSLNSIGAMKDVSETKKQQIILQKFQIPLRSHVKRTVMTHYGLALKT